MESVLPGLCRRLLESADSALLAQPLDRLEHVVRSAEARELLAALHEQGTCTTLREALFDGRLADWARAHCTRREEEALAFALRSLLTDTGDHLDARLTGESVAPLPETLEELRAWAERHQVAALGEQPASELLPEFDLPPDLCLLALAAERPALAARGTSLLARADARLEARAQLERRARALAARELRRQRRRGALPEGPLGLLAQRLRALTEGADPEALEALCFVAARPATLDAQTGEAHGALAPAALDESPPLGVRLLLSGYEQRGLLGECAQCGAGRCMHVLALAARLLDGCLSSADVLHAPLVSFVRVPSWQRFVQALTAPGRAQPSEARICFSVRYAFEHDPRVLVGARLERARTGERFTPGKLSAPQKLLRSELGTPRDEEVLSALAARTRTLTPQFVTADLAILRALVEHPFVQLEQTGEQLEVIEERLRIELVEEPQGIAVRALLRGLPVARLGQRASSEPSRYLARLDEGARTLVFSPLVPSLERLLLALEHFRGVLPPESYRSIGPWLASLSSVAEVTLPTVLEGLARPAPDRLLLRLSPRFDEGLELSLRVRAFTLAALHPPGDGPALVHGLEAGLPCSVRRDLARERVLATELVEALGLASKLGVGRFAYRVENNQEALELLSRVAQLGDKLDVEWAERKAALRVVGTVATVQLSVGLFKRGAWFTLEGGASVGEQQVAIDTLLEAARRGERFVPIGGSDYLEIERELYRRLADAQLCTMTGSEGASLPSGALPLWLAKLGAESHMGDDAGLAFRRRAESLSETDEDAVSPELLAQLRDYQRVGVRWLLQRSSWAEGACLADEMGLGKTLQALCVLEARRARGPALVLAPTSVVDNWRAELARFTPQLGVVIYRGKGRETLLSQLAPGVVLVTSYELLLRDRDAFEPLRFATLVVDEAQLLKNARALRARAVATLRAEFRIALSGTPIENRLSDLWSLFQWIAPGLLGSWSRFRARFAVPIERYESAQRAEVLRALVAPFLLRRTKREVAAELPPRTEVVHLVELSAAERDLYGAALAHARSALGKRKRNEPTRTVQILAELTRLRQLACHPRLVLDDSRVSSSKLEALRRLLTDLLPRGHRVLIFSQFVTHLALVREAVEALSASYLWLDGSTETGERARRIALFQRGEAQLFLISLKAGGTGLNLTAADYVIHMDPWWNPSAEDQASDRAHRIGQTRPVTIVKLVSAGTIEEHVLALHEHKRELAALVVGGEAREPDFAPDLARLELLIES